MSNEVEQEAGQNPVGGSQAVQQVTVQVKDEDAIALYANFCRVTGSPEELIVDFGLNPQPVGIPRDPIHVKQRIIMNFYTKCRCSGTSKSSGFSRPTSKSVCGSSSLLVAR